MPQQDSSHHFAAALGKLMHARLKNGTEALQKFADDPEMPDKLREKAREYISQKKLPKL